ncbi:MAG TPA: D-alanine--D-alanine ligase family protein [Pyrinomonadaceae bacterium]|nr:D-alanine--D-alanine ligase family protein [Pyrinomonadaceae bacterium]
MKTRVLMLFGGRSGEHEISIRSASNVAESLDSDKFELVPIAISTDGEWLDPRASAGLLSENARSVLAADPGEIGDIRYEIVAGRPIDRDREIVVFPVLHGPFGEDGTVQGMLELAQVPYVGCGVLASACGMDKIVMKSLFDQAGLPICRYTWLLRSDWEERRGEFVDQIANHLGFPCFVKPANLGSSVGISKAVDADSLADAIELAAQFDRRIVVEEGLNAREIECAIIGNSKAEASLPGEYVIKDRSKTFLDYEEKYAGTGNNEFVVPSPVSDELADKIRKMAVSAFKAIDGSGLARVDFFLRQDTGALLINEINTMPGLTDASGFPKMWSGSGIPFPVILERLIELAKERFNDKNRNRVTRSENIVLKGGA